MELHTQHDVILAMKKIKEQKSLSLAQIKKMVDETPIDGQTVNLSPTTIRRVFAEGSEDESFNYRGTIRPIANALNVSHGIESEDDLRARCEMLEAVNKLKHEKIEELEAKIQRIKDAQEDKCEECRAQQKFLHDQIDLKDKRMDWKDQQIENQQKQINRLMDILLQHFEEKGL